MAGYQQSEKGGRRGTRTQPESEERAWVQNEVRMWKKAVVLRGPGCVAESGALGEWSRARCMRTRGTGCIVVALVARRAGAYSEASDSAASVVVYEVKKWCRTGRGARAVNSRTEVRLRAGSRRLRQPAWDLIFSCGRLGWNMMALPAGQSHCHLHPAYDQHHHSSARRVPLAHDRSRDRSSGPCLTCPRVPRPIRR